MTIAIIRPPKGQTEYGDALAIVRVGDNAGLAAIFSARATSAADRSEDARDIAEALSLLSGNYATVAAGAAATSAPNTFTSSESGRLKLYNEAGTVLWTPASIEDIEALEDAIDALTATVSAVAASIAAFTGTVTVGVGGDFPTLVAALTALMAKPRLGQVTVSLLGLNSPDSAAGNMAIPDTGFVFDHPDSRNVIIQGPALTGSLRPCTKDDMTGVEATDLAFLKSKFGASIRLNGNTDASNGFAGTVGLAVPHGLGGFKNLLIECYNRYNLDFGYNGSHHESTLGASCIFEDCAIFGGVWGAIGPGAHFVITGSTTLFCYQKGGGPFDLINGTTLRVAIGYLDLYGRPHSANQAKYGINMDGNANLVIDRTPTCGIRMKGNFVHGVRMRGGFADAPSIDFDGVLQPWTVEGGIAFIDRPTIRNFSFATDLDASVSATQTGIVGNSGDGALIFAGAGGVINHAGAAVSAGQCGRVVQGAGGRVVGYGSFDIDDVKASQAIAEFTDSIANSLSVAVTNPRVGSNNVLYVDGKTATVRLYASSGVVYYRRDTGAAITANTFYGASMVAV